MADKASVLKGGKGLQLKVRAWARTMTTGTQVCTLPKGSRFLGASVGGVASDDTGTATVSIGTTTTATELAAALSVKTTSGVGPTEFPLVSGKFGTVFTADQPIFLKYAGQNSNATVGSGFVTIRYTTGNVTNDDTV